MARCWCAMDESRPAAIIRLCALRIPKNPSAICAAACLLPGFIDTHIHFPQVRVTRRHRVHAAGLAANSHAARRGEVSRISLTPRAVAGRIRAVRWRRTAPPRRWYSERTSPQPPRALFEQARASGLRIASGLVLSRPLPAAGVASHDTGAGVPRQPAVDRALPWQGRLRYAVTPRFALSASEADAGSLPHAAAGASDGPVSNAPQRERARRSKRCASSSRTRPDYLALTNASVWSSGVRSSRTTSTPRLRNSRAWRRPELPWRIVPASNAAFGSGIFPLRAHLRTGVRVALGTDVGGGTGFGMLKEACRLT